MGYYNYDYYYFLHGRRELILLQLIAVSRRPLFGQLHCLQQAHARTPDYHEQACEHVYILGAIHIVYLYCNCNKSVKHTFRLKIIK